MGGQSSMQPTGQSNDSGMQQIVGFINTSVNEGQDPVEVVMGLLQQEVDQQIIAQAFMQLGYEEEQLMQLFSAVQERSQPQEPSSPDEQTRNPQEIARNQALEEQAEAEEEQAAMSEKNAMAEQLAMDQGMPVAKSGIEIKPENKGKFTKWAKARGMSVAEAYKKVLANKDKYPPSVVKMANFARNAAGWKKEKGGETEEFVVHMMYDTETGDAYKANTPADHEKYKKLGYLHKDELKKAQEGVEIVKKNGYEYKKVLNPETNKPTYFSRRNGASNWQDLQEEGNIIPLKAVRSDIFADNIEEWEGTEEQKEWDQEEAIRYKELQESKKESPEEVSYDKYGVRVVQFPYGYAGMPPGHIQAQLFDKDTLKLVDKVDGRRAFVNRWVTDRGTNTPMNPNEYEDDENVRIADLELSPEEIKLFLSEAQKFRGTDKGKQKKVLKGLLSEINAPTALGEGKEGSYDFIDSNCATGVCTALGLNPNAYRNAGITDPTEVMDGIIKGKKYRDRITKLVGNKVNSADGLQAIVRNEADYEMSNDASEKISSFLNGISVKERDKLLKSINKSENDLTSFDGIMDVYNALPEGTIPMMLSAGVDEIENNTDFQFDMDGVKNIPNYHYQKWGKDAMNNINSFLGGSSNYWKQTGGEQDNERIKNPNMITRSNNYANPLAFETANDFNLLGAVNVLNSGLTNMFSGKDEDGDGLKDGSFRNLGAKKTLNKLNKGQYYDYNIQVDPNDTNEYAFDELDLFNASKTFDKDKLRTTEEYKADIKENSRVNYNRETGEYDALLSSRDPSNYTYRNIFGQKKDVFNDEKLTNALDGENLNYFEGVDKDTRQQILDFGDAKNNGMPEGTTLNIDRDTGAVRYMGPDTPENKQRDDYRTMMGYNKYGAREKEEEVIEEVSSSNSMIPTDINGQPLAAMNNTPPRVPAPTFLEWSMQDKVRRTGANAPQQYQDYLNGIQSSPQSSTVQANKSNLLDKVGTELDKAGTFIKNKYNQAVPLIKEGAEDVGDFIEDKTNKGLDFLKDIKFEKGGDFLPKAQILGEFDPNNPFNLPDFSQMGQTSYINPETGAPYTTGPSAPVAVNENNPIELDEVTVTAKGNPLNRLQPIGIQPLPNGLDDLQLAPFNTPTPLTQTTDAEDPTPFDDPKVKRTNNFEGGVNRFMDSNFMKGFGDISEFAVEGAGVINDWFRQKNVQDARRENRRRFAVADNIYGTYEDPALKRGVWDVNTGQAQGEGDRTTSWSMTAKEGGEVNVNSEILAALIAAGADIEIL